jgi:type I restriction enzyme R subunit
MRGSAFTESDVESAALAWLESLGWAVKHGPEIAPDGLFAERADYREVVLAQRLHDALLPKLIRGAIRVKDAERFLKERGL